MAGKGKPRRFKDEQEFIDAADNYLIWCKEKGRFGNVAGFAVYCAMNRDTFYAQREYYPDAFTRVNDMLEDEALQHNTQTARMYLMNKFNYTDRSKVEAVNFNHEMTEEEADKVLKLYNIDK
jgi:hypothetical protein